MPSHPIYALTNQYWGVNPHLNSKLQADGATWEEFHHLHIADLFKSLDKALKPYGYRASLIPGLQVREWQEATNTWGTSRRLEADIHIREKQEKPSNILSFPQDAPGATIVLSIPEAQGLTEEAFLSAIAVYSVDPVVGKYGRPVAWIELLSPANKPGGRHSDKYLEKRLNVLQSGQTLVEIDYLHESHPVLRGLPRYQRDGEQRPESASFPYYICVSNPQPTPSRGTVTIYPFIVDMPVPIVAIPLNPDLVFHFDFGAVYNETFAAVYTDEVDYRQKPEPFAAYSFADQDRIAARMLTIATAVYQQKADISTSKPLPLMVPIEDARLRVDDLLAQLENDYMV